MNQLNNIISKNIKELEQLLETGLVKPDDYTYDLNTLRRIEENIKEGNLKQCRLLSKQLKGFSIDALKQIDDYIEKLIKQKINKNDSDNTTEVKSIDQSRPSVHKAEYNTETHNTKKQNEHQSGVDEKQNEPLIHNPTLQTTQLELGIILSNQLIKETTELKTYLDNVVARQRDTDASINNQFEQFRNIQNNMEILSETIKNLEPLLVKIMPDIKEAGKDIKEQLTELLNNSNLIKRVTEHQIEVDSMLKKIRDSLNSDMDDLYKKMRMSAAGVVDEVVENSKKSIVESGVEIVQTATLKTDKKYTNLMIFGLLGFFICSGLTSAFTAKLVATYSSNNTIEYITKLLK